MRVNGVLLQVVFFFYPFQCDFLIFIVCFCSIDLVKKNK